MALWQEMRKWWSRPAPDLLVKRRAWGRALYNRQRREWAVRRRRELIQLLTDYGYPCGSDLTGVGGRWLYQRYYRETGGAVRTFYRDLAVVRQVYAAHYPRGPEEGTCACTPVGRSRSLLSAAATQPHHHSRTHAEQVWFWRRQYTALRLALAHQLPATDVEAVEEYARYLLRAHPVLRPPTWDQPKTRPRQR